MLVLSASPPAWMLQLWVAACHHGLMKQLLLVPVCICGYTDGSGRQLRSVELILLIILNSNTLFNSKKLLFCL